MNPLASINSYATTHPIPMMLVFGLIIVVAFCYFEDRDKKDL